MAWLIMNDIVDYKSEFYPTHIIGFNKEILPVYMGASSAIEDNTIGLYVSDESYNKIDHSKEYVFLHNPDIQSKFLTREYYNLEGLNISTVKDKLSMNRVHYHIWPTPYDSERDRKPDC